MTYIYKSGLKSYILGLITQKRADGFAYISEEQLFRQLDNFCMEYFPDARTITYDFAARWSSARPFEGNGWRVGSERVGNEDIDVSSKLVYGGVAAPQRLLAKPMV